MYRILRTTLPALVLLLAACNAPGAASPSESAPALSASPEASASVSPSADPAASATEEPSATSGSTGGIEVAANPDADALFLERNACQNLDDGYEVKFPSEWNANAEFGSVSQCSWFSSVEYSVDDPDERPDEINIEFFVIDEEREFSSEPMSREEGIVGATQEAVRVEYDDGDETSYEYVVRLGPTPEEGPNLVARTGTEMGGDYELNKAVLDRMMATIEFIGTTQ